MAAHDDLVNHMHRVQTCERDLRDLGMLWQMIESSATISCPDEVAPILPTLIQTRERFNELQQRLIARMVDEQKAALGDELMAQAQCAIDILVRNLYERTADVGFLATDDVVVEFCSGDADHQQTHRAAMVHRLRDYQAKYTVYDDIVLLSPTGEVLVRMDTEATLPRSSDTIVAEALKAPAYVERFRASDLGSGDTPDLLYAHRIAAKGGVNVGVLVLRFRFIDEMHRIFHSGDGQAPPEVALVLIDESGRVIATNDEGHVPTAVTLRPVANGQVVRTSFAGRDYLTVVCASPGYQGYPGPAWRAQAMVSLLTAFRHRDGAAPIPGNVLLDSPELIAIESETQRINRDLRTAVWNGRLMAGNQGDKQAQLKAVLTQVSVAGMRTRARVDMAIKDLYGTSINRMQLRAEQLATLATDLIDRNLYERANDCRWWALSPALQRTLRAPDDGSETRALNALLDHVNGLYTVYTRLIAFDTRGVIRGVSRATDAPGLVGSAIDPRWAAAAQALHNSQQYAVSAFEDTSAHAEGPTYVYLSAVRDAEDGNKLLGGMAIVFNAAREFANMLEDILGDRTGFAAFVENSGKVIASTRPAGVDQPLIEVPGGLGVVEHEGTHYACARVRATGYREFKTSDGYDNRLSAVVALRLGAIEHRRSNLSDQTLIHTAVADRTQAMEVAVFQVGAMRYAVPASVLVDAVAKSEIVRTPHPDPTKLGLVDARAPAGRQMVPVICARQQFGVFYKPRAADGVVLVLRCPRRSELPLMGLRVDDLLAVTDIDRRQLQESPRGFQSFAPWICGLLPMQINTEHGKEPVLVQWIDVSWLTALVQPAGQATEASVLSAPALTTTR
ncbi:MAG: hypothetical protein CFE40_09170 [Burkholderiales bacterium PBB1]|nr:MAG: hypothetical protein CFE40_09170 [Burkholderiales bacterium PBB1]